MVVKLHSKNCPLCGEVITFRWPSQLKLSQKRNSTCRSCRTRKANKSKLRNCKKENNPSWKGYKGVGYKWFSKYFERLSRKKSGSISIEDVYKKLEAQEFKCALTGISLEWSEESGMSIDRIDSIRGYELDNIQIVHKDVNLMKNYFSQDYFINICKKVSENFKD